MRKLLVTIAAAAVAAVTLVPAVAESAKRKTFHFTTHIVGGQISATEAVYKIRDSRAGKGAGVQVVKLDGLSGTDHEVSYYGNASARSHGSFKLGVPDANGISTLTGKGHDTSGTGKLRGFRSTYTYTGTFNTSTGTFKAVLKGVGSVK